MTKLPPYHFSFFFIKKKIHGHPFGPKVQNWTFNSIQSNPSIFNSKWPWAPSNVAARAIRNRRPPIPTPGRPHQKKGHVCLKRFFYKIFVVDYFLFIFQGLTIINFKCIICLYFWDKIQNLFSQNYLFNIKYCEI